MWDGGGNYGYWPMHQSAYSNLPTDQVDWAMLAKQWIAQRGMVGIGPPDYLQPPGPAPLPPFPPVKPVPPAGPIGEVSSAVGGVAAQSHPQSIISCDMENSNSQDSNYYPSSEPEQAPAEGWGNWNGAAMPAWAVPPPPPPMDEAHDNATNEMQYGGDGSQFMGPPFGFNQPPEDMYMGPYEHAGFPQFWNQGPMPGQPMMAQKPFIPVRENLEYRAAPKRGGVRAPWPAMGDIPPLMDDSGIDAAKRRHLPLWIREGLEKMEREKQRQMEKERHEQALLDAKKAREEAQKDGADQDDPQTVVKSIFDSDDEESAPEPSITHQQPISRSSKESVASERKRSPSPIKRQAEEEEEEEDELMTEEEKLAHMMLKVRQMMTEVFLEVTNREMADVAQTVYATEKRKQARAPARQLAKSTALDSLTSLGLGYGSESSDEDGSDNERRLPNEESDDTDDDGVLRQRILQKKADFERKMQELEETERENEIEKRRHAEEHLKPQRNDRNAESNDEVQVSIADSDEAPSRKDKETTGKRVKQIEEKTKKDEKRAPERSRSDKKERSKKEDEEEETSEEVSESGSDSSSESQSGSSDDSSSSSSRKSSAESKELNRRRIKSQLSDGAKERRKEKSDTGRKKTDEQDSKAIRQESALSRKDGEKLRGEKKVEEYQKEESHSRKKSSRHHSAEKIEYDKADQKRRRPTKDHERGRAEDKDRTRGHKDSRGHGKRSRDDRSRSEDDDRRDYPSKTYDNEDRTHRSQRKKARRSRSSSQSSHEHYRLRRSHDKESSPHDQRRSVKDRRLSDQNREHRTSRDRGQQLSRDRRSPKDRDRRSSRDRDRQSSRDRDRRKETKDRSGKKDRARGRSRSHSRSDDS